MSSAQQLALRFHRRRFPPTPAVASTCCAFSPPRRDSSLTSSSSGGDMSPEISMLIRRAAFILAVLTLSALLLYTSTDSLRFIRVSPGSISSSSFARIFFLDNSSTPNPTQQLEEVLKNASIGNKTVILTTLNYAWVSPNSVVDLFLKSFKLGDGTERLVDHLVMIALDEKAYNRCLVIHKHCFALVTEGVDFQEEAYFMTPNYLKMMWRRIDFLRSVLELGYDFVFTDADIMWFRDPFPRFYPDADFQIACDNFLGSPDDMNNRPNGGFNYVKSNNRSIEFYKFWHSSRETYPGYHDQDVLNKIKLHPYISEIGLKIRFLDTAYFGGLCEPSRDLNLVCTMHANCCFGMDSKLHDLKLMLQDWRAFLSLPPDLKNESIISWRVPQNCSLDSLRHFDSQPPWMNVQPEEED
ncbi:Nucleotide-diphospho-sugar transferase [Corchorus olitorius]|uniref:Nucleotide-diphospho-sugar transferase n=1 Tax=Corchorus olitorius TaxID=93759 RepID=A0A1R3HQF6_9ROSI|nr:Nucleotide-diphospho-sugar transferase [Corchorus olitorius]